MMIENPVLPRNRAVHPRDFEEISVLFFAMSGPVRLAVLLKVIEREWSVTELAGDLKIGQSALSQHLAKLRQAAIVKVRRSRQERFYSCTDPLVIRLLEDVGLRHEHVPDMAHSHNRVAASRNPSQASPFAFDYPVENPG